MIEFTKLEDVLISADFHLVDYKTETWYYELVQRYVYGRFWLGDDALSEFNWTIEQQSEFIASLLSGKDENFRELLFIINVENGCDNDDDEEGSGSELICGNQSFLTYAAFCGKVRKTHISKSKKKIQNGFSLKGLTGDFKQYNNLTYETLSESLETKLVLSRCTIFVNTGEDDALTRYQRRKKKILQTLKSQIFNET